MPSTALARQFPHTSVQPKQSPLRICKKTKHRYKRIPFVKPIQDQKYLLSFWEVPATGGYFGGIQTGRALGEIYVRLLGADPDTGGRLHSIIFDLFSGDSLPDSRKGQALGFLMALDEWMIQAARRAPVPLDEMELRTLLDEANNGINER